MPGGPSCQSARPVRAIFISDCHLGLKLGNGNELLQLLMEIQPERLYLVGDFLDAWVLESAWYWPPVNADIIDRLKHLQTSGTRIFYTPGNHDDFLREPSSAWPTKDWKVDIWPFVDADGIPKTQIDEMEIADEFAYELMDGRRLLVMHGDLLDTVEKKLKPLSTFGSWVFLRIVGWNARSNRMLGSFGFRPWNYSFTIKRVSKRIQGAYGRFRKKLVAYARELEYDGIICGHVHRPEISTIEQEVYINTGDWLENSSVLIEEMDGTLVLQNQGQTIAKLDSLVS